MLFLADLTGICQMHSMFLSLSLSLSSVLCQMICRDDGELLLVLGTALSGSLVECDVGVGGRDVAFVSIAPPHACPSVTFVLLHHGQHLAFLHGDRALARA